MSAYSHPPTTELWRGSRAGESWSVIRITSVCEEVRQGDPLCGKLRASVENADWLLAKIIDSASARCRRSATRLLRSEPQALPFRGHDPHSRASVSCLT